MTSSARYWEGCKLGFLLISTPGRNRAQLQWPMRRARFWPLEVVPRHVFLAFFFCRAKPCAERVIEQKRSTSPKFSSDLRAKNGALKTITLQRTSFASRKRQGSARLA